MCNRENRLISALLCAALASLGGAAACTAEEEEEEDDEDHEPPPDLPEPEHVLMPPLAFTGFDGSRRFLVPMYTSLEHASWEVEEPSIASITPVPTPPFLADFGESFALLTTRAPGTTRVFAASGDLRLEATVTVAEYAAEEVEVGELRYNDPADAHLPERVACAACHLEAGGADHSPLALAFYEDDEILPAITESAYADGYVLDDGNHVWHLTPEEEVGIVPYLRSLPPRGF